MIAQEPTSSLPTGAYAASDWGYCRCNGDSRIISGIHQHVNGIAVYVTAVQRKDGSIDLGEPPTINVGDNLEFSVTQTRRLAELLVAAANLVDKWINNPKALRDHLKSALGHIGQAIALTEFLAGRIDGIGEVDVFYEYRAQLRGIAEALGEMVG